MRNILLSIWYSIRVPITGAIVFALCLTAMVLTVQHLNNNDGIYPHASGKAVYIAGEACVINATEDITVQQFEQMAQFCKTHHKAVLDMKQIKQLLKQP